ncbi:hypothetical protein BKA83DRAFT_4123777 [Pisolithus microcarpus]|nr:hypothetical protein BKA83DRAFT_4123777 [Pisolithus microcarpus]
MESLKPTGASSVRFGDVPTNALLVHLQPTLYPLTLELGLVIAEDPVSFSEVHRERFSGDEDTTNIIKRRPAALVTGKLHQNQYDSGICITNMQRSVDHGSKGTRLNDADNARRLHLSRFDVGESEPSYVWEGWQDRTEVARERIPLGVEGDIGLLALARYNCWYISCTVRCRAGRTLAQYAHTQKLVTRVSATNTMNAGTFRGVKRPL